MNLENLSADIAARIPEITRDSALNNAQTIKGIIKQYQPKEEPIVIRATHDDQPDSITYKFAMAGIIGMFTVLIIATIALAFSMQTKPQPQPQIVDNFFIKGWDAAMAAKYGSNRQYVTNVVTVTNYVQTGAWPTNTLHQ